MFSFSLAGIKVTYDVTRKPGMRVVDVKVRCTECTIPMFAPLEPEKVYDVLTSSYVIAGGNGYKMIPKNMLEKKSYRMYNS